METIRARTALTPTGGFLTAGDGPGFTHTFNPAVGCAFAPGACGAFCYAREFAERLGGKGTWGQRVAVKSNAPEPRVPGVRGVFASGHALTNRPRPTDARAPNRV